jgi:catechol 2,3-dioxygenase-like lactoylglutathione lyase family enzyme
VPVSVKDTIEMSGLRTTYGSLAFKDNRQDDSEIVVRLRRAGAVILGKTTPPEFALLGATANRQGRPGANPWDLGRTCGGSSGGAGAAVAAGLGPLAVGTDSAGSIRVPAAYNGVFGLKPTYQRIPSVQKWRASPLRSHNGPLARTVADAALLWYKTHLNAPVRQGFPDTDLNADNCRVERGSDRTWPALNREGMFRTPRAGVEFGDVVLTWYANQGAEPLASSRGQMQDHIGLSVRDLDAWVAKLKDEGVTFLDGPYRLGATRAVMIEGPSREAIELVEVK